MIITPTKIKFQVSLISQTAMNLPNWGYVEWFGIEELYLPYPFLDDYYLGHGVADRYGSFEVEAFETFAYLAAYKNQDFLCSIEFPFIVETGMIISVNNFRLINKGIKPHEAGIRK